MLVATAKVAPGMGPYVLTQDGDPITGQLSRIEVLRRFRMAISNREIGSVFRIRKIIGADVVFTARAVQRISDADSTNGNEHADVFYNWIKANFSQYDPRFAGAYVCKPSSQHAYGNADDFFFDSLAHQDTVAAAAVAHADELHIDHVISRDRIWNPEEGWHNYTGDYHSHIHADFLPQYSGACGVRP
jgi:hypothetical protein